SILRHGGNGSVAERGGFAADILFLYPFLKIQHPFRVIFRFLAAFRTVENEKQGKIVLILYGAVSHDILGSAHFHKARRCNAVTSRKWCKEIDLHIPEFFIPRESCNPVSDDFYSAHCVTPSYQYSVAALAPLSGLLLR